MTINQNLLAGLSNATGQLRNASDPRRIIGNPTTIEDSVLGKIAGQNIKSFTFPSDLPKYHFVLIENNWSIKPVSTQEGYRFPLTARKIFKLQLPTPLIDGFEVNYETDKNFLGEMLGGRANQLLGAAGITLNTFRTITMSSPAYRTFDFTWKFSPKNFKEAQEIRKITFALRKGMSPKTTIAGKFVLDFPYLYTMYFSPNYQYLYKFKPCVLTALSVDYQGGNPFPGFYRAEGNNQNESPPESVIMQTKWIEMEYWLDGVRGDENSPGDYKHDNYIPKPNPFDGWNFYTNEQPANPSPGLPIYPWPIEQPTP